MTFDFDAVLERLGKGSAEDRCKAWDDLHWNSDQLTHWQLPPLHVFLKSETDEKVKLYANERLLAIYGRILFHSVHPPREHTLRDYIWYQFTGLRHDPFKSAVIGICDEAHQK